MKSQKRASETPDILQANELKSGLLYDSLGRLRVAVYLRVGNGSQLSGSRKVDKPSWMK